MNPERDPYDFILNPNTPAPKKPLAVASSNSFLIRIGIIVGGAILVMTIGAIIVSLIFSKKTNTTTIVTLAATQTEIVRVSGLLSSGTDQTNVQTIKNYAANVNLSVASQLHSTLQYLARNSVKPGPKLLAVKKNSSTDTAFTTAVQNSTFDTVFVQTLQTELQSYASDLKTYYNNSSDTAAKILLATDYSQVQLLMKQAPAVIPIGQ